MKKRGIIAGIILALVVAALFLADRFPQDANPIGRFSIPAQANLESPATQWCGKSVLHQMKGIALVIHGLNLKPARMDPLIRLLNAAGIDALNVSLLGHGANYSRRPGSRSEDARMDAFRAASFTRWYSEVRGAYLEARARSDRKSTDLYLVGYSLGGLLGCSLLVSDPAVRFAKMVLLAPALNVQAKVQLLRALTPFSGLVIDSLSPPSYRSNDGTPMAAYQALFEALDRFQGGASQALNVPTLVLIDPEDEFISAEALAEMIADRKLDRWTIRTVRKTSQAGRYAHHLLIDEETVGKEAWREMAAVIRDHLAPAAKTTPVR